MDLEQCSSQNAMENKINRTITVTNIPPETTQDNIIIHFQKRKHGGGDVETIQLTDDGVARVTFEKEETVDDVLANDHLLNDRRLRVTRYRPLPQAPIKEGHGSSAKETKERLKHYLPGFYLKVFDNVTATVNQEIFRADDPLTKELMHEMKRKFKINLQSTTNEIRVSGTLEEIQRSHDFLRDSLQGAPGCSPTERSGGPKSLKLDEHLGDVKGDKGPAAGTDTGRERRKKAETAKYPEHGYSISQLEHAQGGGEAIGAETEGKIEPQQFETIPLPLKFLMHFNTQALQDLHLTFDVDIKPSPDHASVTLFPGERCDADKFNGACDAFLSCYHGAQTGMISQEVSLDLPHGESLYDYSASNIEVDLPVLIEHGSEPSQLVLYGDTASVTAAKERFLTLSVLEDSWEFFGGRMVYRNQSGKSDPNPREIIKRKTSTGTTLSVWSGDITQLKVKAIVNPSNGHLKHMAGLARAITKAGGKSIQEESDSIVRSKGEVNVGSAVYTKAGRLRCKFVIHAVGPEWGMYDDVQCGKLLSDACLDSLRIAQRLEVKSIAFPAISSGLFGVPLDVCAGAMLNAVETYLEVNASRKKVLTDIRFVHIDDDAVEIFKNELLQRYPK